MYEIFVDDVDLKVKIEDNKTKTIRTAINEFIGNIKLIEKEDNYVYLTLNISFINIYCIEKDFYKLVGIPSKNFKTLKFKIDLINNYIDTNILAENKKISVSTSVIKNIEIIEDNTNILKNRIFVIKEINVEE